MKYFGYIVVILLALASCKPGIPSDVLSEGTMVDVLYDMHIAQAMEDRPDMLKDQKEIIALRASILEKHGITKKEWDRSFFFYCGHTDYMDEIYADLSERLNDEVVALGGKAQGMTETEEADSTNIWDQDPAIVLWQDAPYNRVTFSVTPDSTFHDGDRINLQYETQMLFQDGVKDVTVSMNVYYANDSICTRTNHISFDGPGVISISNDVERLKVKKITGFFLMTKNRPGTLEPVQKDMSLTFRMAAIKNIKLLHLHTMPPATHAGNAPNMDDKMPPRPDTLINHDEQDNQHKKQEGNIRLLRSR